jgi:tetratricopeptide (TPR) repeat protein
MIVVGGLLGATAWALWRKPVWGFLGAWFFLILAPTSSIMPIGDVIYEHRMYLSLAAVVTMVVVGIFAAGSALLTKQPVLGQILTGTAAGTVVLFLATLTIQRNRDYRSELTIWRDTVNKCPGNPRARTNLGLALVDAGRVPEAIQQYEQALRIKPDLVEGHYNFGHALIKEGKTQEAIAHYREALRVKPDLAEANCSLGYALIQAGKAAEAIPYLERSLRAKPDFAEAHCNLGNALAQVGKTQEAAAHWELSLRFNPENADVQNNLAIVLAQAGKTEEAISHWEKALRIKPDHAEARKNLAYCLSQAGKQ